MRKRKPSRSPHGSLFPSLRETATHRGRAWAPIPRPFPEFNHDANALIRLARDARKKFYCTGMPCEKPVFHRTWARIAPTAHAGYFNRRQFWRQPAPSATLPWAGMLRCKRSKNQLQSFFRCLGGPTATVECAGCHKNACGPDNLPGTLDGFAGVRVPHAGFSRRTINPQFHVSWRNSRPTCENLPYHV